MLILPHHAATRAFKDRAGRHLVAVRPGWFLALEHGRPFVALDKGPESQMTNRNRLGILPKMRRRHSDAVHFP